MKQLKISGDLSMVDVFVPKLMKYIEQNRGIKIGHMRNHNTVGLELQNGDIYIAHVYETKTMIIMEWFKR